MAAASEPQVRFIDVDKTYDGETTVIAGLNLSIRPGEFLTLLGPSGSGKTTTLMLLAGFEQPTAGHIEIDGCSIEAEPAWRRNLGIVFQDYALFPHMTVSENIAFPLTVRKLRKSEVAARVAAALVMVKLSGLGERRPNQLSGGQQQRVALARAMVFSPKIVLMDEPLGALDKQLRDQMQIEIKRLQRELGVTVIYVTHDQTEALAMSDRIAVFNRGRIRQIDTPLELYERPCDAFVAQFIGENNRMAGRIVAFVEGRAQVRLEGGATVVATAGDGLATGAPVVLSVRPERIVVNPTSRPEDNAFRARVRDIVYFGDHLRLFFKLSGEPLELVAKIPIDSRQGALNAEGEVDISWSPDDCRALSQS